MKKILHYNNTNFIEKLNFFISNSRGTGLDISEQVKSIISNVMKNGDKAINELTLKYDNYDIFKNGIRVSENDINKAYDACDKELIYALEQAAERIRAFVEGSEIIQQEKQHVQDPYSFRCIPQVHGATKDTLAFVEKTFITEINSVTDNPNIFAKEDKIISGGNFHGQPLALALDYLKIAMSELGNISERRVFQLVSGLRTN